VDPGPERRGGEESLIAAAIDEDVRTDADAARGFVWLIVRRVISICFGFNLLGFRILGFSPLRFRVPAGSQLGFRLSPGI
jgi:hypothetical protein